MKPHVHSVPPDPREHPHWVERLPCGGSFSWKHNGQHWVHVGDSFDYTPDLTLRERYEEIE